MSKKKTYDEEEDEKTLQFEQDEVALQDTDAYDNDGEVDDEDVEEDASKGKTGRKRLISGLLNDGESGVTSMKDLLRNMEFNGEWFRRNIGFIIVVTLCLLAFVTNRYQAQQEMIEEARLKKELAEMKYKWLTRFSELTTSTRQSQIEDRLKQLGDTTLTLSREAPYIIKASK